MLSSSESPSSPVVPPGGEIHVGEHQLGTALADGIEGLRGRANGHSLKALALKEDAKAQPHRFIIVYYQYHRRKIS